MFSNYEMWGRNHNDGFGRLLEICREKQTVLDIGAHIGLCALPVSKIIHGSGTVIAFEPGDANFRYLQRHIQFNQAQNIEAFPFLVGEESRDEVPFYESPAPTGMNSIVRYKELASADWVTRKQVCLDDFCREHQIAPEVIKIDVEGAEIGVLRGMRETLKTCRPSIILSVHPRHLELLGESEDILLDTLKELN